MDKRNGSYLCNIVIAAIVLIICFNIPVNLSNNNFIILTILLVLLTCTIVIAFSLFSLIISGINFLGNKIQEHKYKTQMQDLPSALYYIKWSQEPISSVLDNLSEEEKSLPAQVSQKDNKKQPASEKDNKSHEENHYKFYSDLVDKFSNFEEKRLRTIKSFLSIKYYKFNKRINYKIVVWGAFWVIFIMYAILMPKNPKIDLTSITTIKDFTKIFILNTSSIVKSLMFEDPILFSFLCIYLFLLVVLLPLVVVDRSVRIHNETEIVLAAVKQALEEKSNSKNDDDKTSTKTVKRTDSDKSKIKSQSCDNKKRD